MRRRQNRSETTQDRESSVCTRPGRNGEAVPRWVYDTAKKRSSNDAEFEHVDIGHFNLTLLDEPGIISQGQYKHVMGILTDKDIFKFISKNESVVLSFVSEQTIGRDVADRFDTLLLDDIIHRQV